MKLRDWINLFYVLTGLAVVGAIIYGLKKLKDLVNPSGTLAWWQKALGLAKPGTQVEDLTGQPGQDISDAAEAAAQSPQIAYDLARSAYMKARGLSPAWDDPKAAGWAWDSYSAWVQAGMPQLQKAEN